jgi:spore coat protein A, manganese oxidase
MEAGGERRFRRRRFVQGAATGAAALALPAWLRPGGSEGPPLALAAAVEPFTRRLPIPDVLTDPEISIRMRPARVQILPGEKTPMWTYDGTFPGPTIRRPAGERTEVTFLHDLGKKAGELSVHLHGGHTSSAHDGQPGGLTRSQPRSLYCDISPELSARASGNDLLIEPGRKRKYVYELTEDGGPERAAFQWYHDHRLDVTGRNVWRGLAGMFIVDDEFDSSLNFPTGKRDLPLMIADRSFNAENRLTNPFPRLEPPADGAIGKHVLVNGAALPFHPVSPQRYRLRLLNASNFRAYNLFLTGGANVTQIATEAGLLPAPVPRNGDRVLIGPGERVELIVDFAGALGQDVLLKSGPRADGEDGLGSKPYSGTLMQFRVGDQPVADTTADPALMSTLRPLPAWTQGVTPDSPIDFEWSVSRALGPWLINGRTFNPNRVETSPRLDSVPVWRIFNGSQVAHMMHAHHTDWYLLSRNGQPPAPHEAGLKETFFMDPFEEIVIAGKMSDYTGKYVMHCHMLDHEDHGLMSQFEVVAP